MRVQVRSGVRLRRNAIMVAVVVAGLIVVGRITGVLVDWLWFSSVGYVDVFWTVLSAQALLFVAVFAVSAGAIWVSGFLAHHYARSLGTSQAGPAFLVGYAGAHKRTDRPGRAAHSLALRHRWRRPPLRARHRRRRNLELGHGASLPPTGALWRARSDLRQGHRLLSLLAARLYCAQELAASAGLLQRGIRRRNLLGARRHHSRTIAALGSRPPSPLMVRHCSACSSR